MSLHNVVANTYSQIATAVSSPTWTRKPALIHAYLRLTAKEALLRRQLIKPPESERIIGARISYLDYRTLVDLLKEVFVAAPYYFKAVSGSPFIIDAGSNIGMSVMFFKLLYPDADILAFEPDPPTFAVLQKNVDQNRLVGVATVNKALYGYAGEIEFYFDSSTAGSVSMTVHNANRLTGRRTVPCVRLSDYIDRPVDFLKLDVEGAEGVVLRDIRERDKLRLIRQMAIEYHPLKSGPENRLSDCLRILEEGQFAISVQSTFQDGTPGGDHIMIYAAQRSA